MEFPNIDPVIFSLGPLVVRWYAVAYLVGFLLGWRYILALVGHVAEAKPARADIDDFISWAIIGVILGGRLGYILFYQLDFYMDNPGEILKVWRGGMSFHGGMLGVVFSTLLFTRRRALPLLRMADYLACAAPIGLFFGRIANFINGELFGRVTDSSWGVVFPYGGSEPRHPSQLYEAALEGFVLFFVLLALWRISFVRKRPGFLTGFFLLGYGAARSVVELFREPDAHLGFIFGQISMGQILSAPMIVLGVGLVVYVLRKGRSI